MVCKRMQYKIYIPAPHAIYEVFGICDRNPKTRINLSRMYYLGRLGGTGYLSVLPVDQGIELYPGCELWFGQLSGHGLVI